ncbi:transcription factor bHLH130 isoform X1 [Daucus carota subsp. sativus]|uniref:transcription factor bHLH130 isoform X1 n=1 Tax=Daucus carota subsp. sativus TaxID=79200 RepID=UPI0007F029C5|nr:PREDICTED: transcription factor bHLH130-like isoform X1 [Daucus carota subsp. sativus]
MYNSREMDSLLFSSNFRFATAAEFTKPKDLMHSELKNYRSRDFETTGQRKEEEQSSDCFLEALCADTVGGQPGRADYLDMKASNIEEVDFNARFGAGDSKVNGGEKEVVADSGYLVACGAGNMYSDNMSQVKSQKSISSSNCSNLIRHSSSPAGFFANLADEIGFTETNDVGNFRSGRETNTELNFKSGRLGDYIDISSKRSSHSRFMPQIAESLDEKIEISDGYLANGQHGGDSNRLYVPNLQNDSTCNSLKRYRDGEGKMLADMNAMDTPVLINSNDDPKHYTSGLLHQLSLPNTFAEITTMENFVNFQQDSTPCKIRAKRGFATHPRSIAERVRRTRISARMKKLQDLFPNMDKQANTADMLDLAVVYIKDLQKEVQTLNETRAKCTCPSIRK